MSELDAVAGRQRVAAILLSLGEEERAAIMRNMKPEVVALVADAMLELDPRLTGDGVIDQLYGDLARALNGKRTIRACETGDLVDLLGRTFGQQRAQQMLDQIESRRREQRPFLALEDYRAFEVARVLRNEAPSVAALVLAHLDPAVSAEVLRSFEDESAVDVVRRMASLEPPNPDVLETISSALVEELEAAPPIRGDSDPSSRLKTVATLLNNASPGMEKSVIDSIAEDNAEMAEELREYMFTWEDIAAIGKRTMQKILGTVDTKTLSVALKGCSESVEENILGNLSSRVREMVAEERELSGPMPLTDVNSARDEILKNIRAMIEAGEFRPSRGGDELVA